jgi:Tfp pilus assembly protein PilZ
MRRVIVTIKDGVPKVEVQCVKGADCKKLTRQLEADLGQTVSDTPTSEMYETQGIKVGH